MLLRLLATFVLAIAVAGMVILLNRYVFKRQLPKWVLPSAIAISIIGFQIYDEYQWYGRVRSALPSNVVILQERAPAQAWRPWSYMAPSVSNFTYVDRAKLDKIDEIGDIYAGMVSSLSRLGASTHAIFAFDCETGRFGLSNQDLAKIQWVAMDEAWRGQICEAG